MNWPLNAPYHHTIAKGKKKSIDKLIALLIEGYINVVNFSRMLWYCWLLIIIVVGILVKAWQINYFQNIFLSNCVMHASKGLNHAFTKSSHHFINFGALNELIKYMNFLIFACGNLSNAIKWTRWIECNLNWTRISWHSQDLKKITYWLDFV